MTVHPAAGLDVGDRGQIGAGDITVEIGGVNDVGRANGIVDHDLRLIMERVADVAILVGLRADLAVVEHVFCGDVMTPVYDGGFPRFSVLKEYVVVPCVGTTR